MKKFFVSVFFFCGILMVIVQLITNVLLPRIVTSNTYSAASIDKQKLLKETPSPRIILTGGSNLAFGIDSEVINAITGYHVVNMGLHAGLGLKYILNETLGGIRENDLVILIPEYYLVERNQRLLALLDAANPESWQYMSLNPFEYARFKMYQVQIFFRFKFYGGESLDDIYVRSGFNRSGDLVTHLEKEWNSAKRSAPVRLGKMDYAGEFSDMQKFILKAREKHARVFFSFPGISMSDCLLNADRYSEYKQQANESLTCDLIGSPELFCFPDEDTFDTKYHLTSKSRLERSKLLGELILKEINKSQ